MNFEGQKGKEIGTGESTNHLKKDKKWWVWLIFTLIAGVGYYLRTRNLSFLKDITTGKLIPLALDPFAFLRYARIIVETGGLPAIDYMRYVPWGYPDLVEFRLLSFFIAYLFKFLHFFNSSLTLEKVHVLYPPIMFVVGLVFFFLLVRKLFDYKVALGGSLLLTLIPSYIHRTVAGFSDKEAFGMALFFAGLYLFVKGWQEKKIKKNIIFGAAAGLAAGALGLVWGGFAFLVTIIALFSFINFAFLRFRKRIFFTYFMWYLSFYLFMILFRSYNLRIIIGEYYNALATLTFFVGILSYYVLKFNLRHKIESKFKLPWNFVILILTGIIGILFSMIVIGPNFIFSQIKQIFITLTTPFGNDRWQLTVAEAHQPYLSDLIGQIGWKFFWVYLLGSMVLVYNLLKKFSKWVKIPGLIFYILFILGFSFSRFSQGSNVLNGTSFFSQKIMYFGGIALLILTYLGYYLYTYYKDKISFNKILDLNSNYILVFIWFFVLLVASRSAIRLFFIFSVIVALLAAYFIIKFFYLSLKIKGLRLNLLNLFSIRINKYYIKGVIWILLFFIVVSPISIAGGFAFGLFGRGVVIEHFQSTYDIGRFAGPSYNQQWQVAGEWVRENTPKEAVFAHWWDYGYWVQTGWERATITDGGNAKVSLNHFMGRNVITGQNEEEALKFLKAHNATHLLMISDEIGKYPAFSSIGSDENWDRYSWVLPFGMDDGRTQRIGNTNVYTYTGVSRLDEDFEFNGTKFTRGDSFIFAFFIQIGEIEGTSFVQNAFAVMGNNAGEQARVPLQCVVINGQEMNFSIENGLEGCLLIVPRIDGENVNPIGAGFYVSERVRRSLFAQLFLLDKPGKYFKQVYSNEDTFSLMLFNGRTLGPLKIWEVSYPEDLEVPEHYYKDVLPNPKVTSVEGRF